MDDKLAKVAGAAEAASSIIASVEPTTSTVLHGLGKAADGLRTALTIRAKTWWDYVREEKADDDFEKTLEYETFDSRQAATIFETPRAALDSVDDEALRPLARLARFYAGTKRGQRDRFFRSCVRMVRDATGEELENLRRVVVWTLTVVKRDDFHLVQRGPKVMVVRDEHQHEHPDKAGIHAELVDNAAPVFRMLAEYDVLRPTSATYSGGAPSNIEGTREAFLRLRYVLSGARPDDWGKVDPQMETHTAPA